MSADRGSAPDLDLVADYAAGVLDGTPTGAAVAARLADDPAWAALYGALAPAESAVAADLASWTAEPTGDAGVPVPADVVARLDRALGEAARGVPGAVGAGAAATGTVGTSAVAAGPGSSTDAGTAEQGSTSTVVSLAAQRDRGRRDRGGRDRGRRTRWALGGAAAASVAVLAVAGVGLGVLQTGSENADVTSSGREESGGSAVDGSAGSAQAPPGSTGAPSARSSPGIAIPNDAERPIGRRLVASGQDYDRAGLAADVRILLAAPPVGTSRSSGGPTSGLEAPLGRDLPAGLDALRELTVPSTLAGCLQALAAGGATGAEAAAGSTLLVDYARFEGRPAIVVVLRGDGGMLEAVVAGPGCGRTDSDEVVRVPLAR